MIDKKEEYISTDIPLGMIIHNIEIAFKRSGQLAKAAGAVAKLITKEGKSARPRKTFQKFMDFKFMGGSIESIADEKSSV